MKNKLILYSKIDFESKLESYVKKLFEEESIQKGNEVTLLLHSNDDFCHRLGDLNPAETTPNKTLLLPEGVNSNALLGFMNSVYSSELGGHRFEIAIAPTNIVITFPLDIVQIDFLKNLQYRANIVYHIFMEENKYKSRDMGENLQDYIPFMDFEIV